jgi:hypothetical protein
MIGGQIQVYKSFEECFTKNKKIDFLKISSCMSFHIDFDVIGANLDSCTGTYSS